MRYSDSTCNLNGMKQVIPRTMWQQSDRSNSTRRGTCPNIFLSQALRLNTGREEAQRFRAYQTFDTLLSSCCTLGPRSATYESEVILFSIRSVGFYHDLNLKHKFLRLCLMCLSYATLCICRRVLLSHKILLWVVLIF